MQLEEIKKDNEKAIDRHQEEKSKCQQEFEEMKYSGEAKLSRLVRLIRMSLILSLILSNMMYILDH